MPDVPAREMMVVAGEASGDERAAELVNQLHQQYPHLRLFGMGGERLRAEGTEILVDIRDTAVFGFAEALRAARRMRGYMDNLLAEWDRRAPQAALLVDFGGFNLRLARRLKERGARIVYYISPQVWASRPKRALAIRRYVDLLLVVFPFEVDFYHERGVEAIFTGHPLLDTVKRTRDRTETLAMLGFDPERRFVCLMPGSRSGEIRRLLPLMLRVVGKLGKDGITQFALIAAPGVAEQVRAQLPQNAGIRVITSDKYDVIAAADLVLLASGTAALEVALLGAPAVVVYRTSWLTGFLAKFLLHIPWVSLPNIIMDEEIYPELLQANCTVAAVTDAARDILEHPERCDRIRGKLADLKNRLGMQGAAARAADRIADFLEQG